MPRPMTRRPLGEPEELEALFEPLGRDGPEALRALLLLDFPLALMLELRDLLLPPLLRFGMLILG